MNMVMNKLTQRKIVEILIAKEIEQLGYKTKIVLPSKDDRDVRVFTDLITGPMLDIIVKIRKELNVCAFISFTENGVYVRFHDYDR